MSKAISNISMGKKFKHLYNKTPKVKNDFKSLNSLEIPKTDAELKIQLDSIKNKSLKKQLLNSKLLWLGGTAIGLSAFYIDHYIKGNTGCFLESGGNTCKLIDLSCCNPHESTYIEKCSDEIIQRLNIDKKSCDHYDFNNPVCCEKCDCKHYSCEPDEEMRCHRATTAEALTYFSENMTSSVTDTFYNILTSSNILKIISIGFLTLVIGLVIYKLI